MFVTLPSVTALRQACHENPHCVSHTFFVTLTSHHFRATTLFVPPPFVPPVPPDLTFLPTFGPEVKMAAPGAVEAFRNALRNYGSEEGEEDLDGMATKPDRAVQFMVEDIENKSLTVVVDKGVLDVMKYLCGDDLADVVIIGIDDDLFGGCFRVTGFPYVPSDCPVSPGPESDSESDTESDTGYWWWETKKWKTPLNYVLYPHMEVAATLVKNGGQAVTKEWTDGVGSFKGTAKWCGDAIVTTSVSVCANEVCTTCRLLMASHDVLAADVRMPEVAAS